MQICYEEIQHNLFLIQSQIKDNRARVLWRKGPYFYVAKKEESN